MCIISQTKLGSEVAELLGLAFSGHTELDYAIELSSFCLMVVVLGLCCTTMTHDRGNWVSFVFRSPFVFGDI